MSNKDTGDGAPDLSALQETFDHQQAKITALKELVRQSEAAQGQKTATAQEKVKNIAQRLTHLKSKTFRLKKGDKQINEIKEENIGHGDLESVDETPQGSSGRARSETPGAEKIQLLRKQMEENRQKMAEREHSKRDIEELVTQLKAKFDSSQMAIERSSQLGRSVDDLSHYKHPGIVGLSKFQSASDLSYSSPTVDQERIKFLEKRLSEVQTEMKSKESEFLHKDPKSEHLKIIKQLEGKILDFEENIKEKESIIEARTQAVSLLSENMSLKGKNTVDLLEETKQEMVEMQKKFVEAEEMYQQEIDAMRNEIETKDCRIAELSEINDILETARFDLTCTTSALKTRIGDLEEECKKLTELNADYVKRMGEGETHSSDKPVTSENQDVQEKMESLERSLQEHLEKLSTQTETIEKLEGDLVEKKVEYNVLNANFIVLQDKLKSMAPKSLFSSPPPNEEAEAEITKLKEQLDQANKTAIKNKLKINQLQKQLKQSNKTQSKGKDDAKPEEEDSAKIIEATAEEIPSAKDDEARRVSGHIESIELEEKIEILTKTIADLRQEVHELNAKKTDLNSRLNRYIAENMELLDKLEKLSKGSSAESIEMVENLTQQEKMEMAELHMLAIQSNAAPEFAEPTAEDEIDDTGAMSQDLSESLIKLREDSSMLMQKIEMFTNERREVMEKMEDLSMENSNYVKKLEDANDSRDELLKDYEALKVEKMTLETALADVTKEKTELLQNLKELTANRNELQGEINSLTREKIASSRPTIQIDMPDALILSSTSENCAGVLATLDTELENYRKVKDKNGKFNVSKKVAKEARNAHTLMKKLVDDLDRSVSYTQLLESQLNVIKQMQQEQENTVPPTSSSPQSEDFIVLSYEKDDTKEETQETENNNQQKESTQSEPSPEKVDKSTEPFYDIDEQHRTELDRIRAEFESRLDVCGKEIQILKTLVAEQKEQLISTFVEHENELEAKIREISEYEDRVKLMSEEMEATKTQMSSSQDKYIVELQNKIELLETILNENNVLLDQKGNEMKHKQDTIDTLNAQIIDMYKTMEETTGQVTEKEDDIQRLEQLLQANENEIAKLQKRCENSESAFDELNDEVEEKIKEIERLQLKMKDQDNKSRLEGNIKMLEQSIRQVEEQNNRLSRDLNEERMNNQRLMNRLSTDGDDQRSKVQQLEMDLEKLEDKNKEQLDKLKKFAANIKKKNVQCKEFEDQIAQLKQELQQKGHIQEENYQQKSAGLENQLMCLSTENQNLVQNIEHLKTEHRDLVQWQQNHIQLITKKDAIIVELNDRIRKSDAQIAVLNSLVEELKMQLGQFNLITKELQSKTNQITELSNLVQQLEMDRGQYNSMVEELRSKTAQITHLNNLVQGMKMERGQFDSMVEELKSKTTKLEKCKAIIKAKNQTIKTLNDQLKPAENPAEKAVNAEAELNALKDEIATLKNANENIKSTYKIKIEEHEHYHETIETENEELKEKISILEEGIAFIEEQRAVLEKQVEKLENELKNEANEARQNDDELQLKLKSLTEHNEALQQKLHESKSTAGDIAGLMQDVQDEKNELQRKNSILKLTIQELKDGQLIELQSNNLLLQEQNQFLQLELKRQTSEFDQKLAQKNSEVVELEDSLVIQMNALENERRSIQESLQISRDEYAELRESFTRFRETATIERSDMERELNQTQLELEQFNQTHSELQELRIKIVHDQTEIDSLKSQQQNLMQTYDAEVNALKQQISELESMRNQIGQNQTDDQIFIQNENERLQTLIAAKEIEIQNYQRQNLQLQMSAMPAPVDPFAGISTGSQINIDNETIGELRGKLSEATEIQQVLQRDFTAAQLQIQQFNDEWNEVQQHLSQLKDQNRDLQSHLAVKISTIEDLDSKLLKSNNELVDVKSSNGGLQTELNALNERLQRQDEENQQKIDELQRLQIELLNAQRGHAKLQQDVTNKQILIDTISADLLKLTGENNVLKSQVENLEISFKNQQTLDYESKLQLAQQEVQNLHNLNAALNEKLETLNQFNAQYLTQLNELQNTILLKDQDINRLHDELQIASRSLVDEPIVSMKSVETVSATPSESVRKHEETISALEQYISQLQLQLRISTADCEQQAQIIQSLEGEIQAQTSDYEKQIDKKRSDQKNENIPPENPLSAATTQPEPSSSIPSFNSSMFFGGGSSSTSDFDQAFADRQHQQKMEEESYEGVPVVEEVIVPKKAYLCYDDEDNKPSGGIGSGTDDGWGFGSDEAALEEQHQNTVPLNMSQSLLVPAQMEYEVKLQVLEDQIHELKLERDQIHDEATNLKTTVAKLMKKLKEFKMKNEELNLAQRRKSSSTESNDLDLAIQEELNSQVKTLELKLKELRTEHDKDSMEKESFLKRIDVLTAANDRLTEMKEKQDQEMNLAKRNIKELNYKLEQLSEWGDKSDSQLSNEEVAKVQSLLNEEKNHTLVLEERIRKLQNSLVVKNDAEQELTDAEEKLHELTIETENLQRELLSKYHTIQRLEAEIQKLKNESQQLMSTVDVLTGESRHIKRSLDELMADHNQKINENQNLSKELQKLANRNKELSAEIDQMNNSNFFGNDKITNTVQELEQTVQELTATVQYKDAEIVHLNQKANDALIDNQSKETMINEKSLEIQLLHEQVVKLQDRASSVVNQKVEGGDSEDLRKSNASLQLRICEFEDERQQMEHELSVLNDQVLKSLSMEDQMKATILEIDMKNSEIAELRHSLDLLKQHQHGEDSHKNEFDSQVALVNAQWEQVLEQRCAELADSWRQHLATKDAEFNEIEQRLLEEISEMKNNQTLPSIQSINQDQQIDIQPHIPVHKNDPETMKMLEEKISKQDEEITSLKQQLAVRSAEYARVLTQLDPYGHRAPPSSMMSIGGSLNQTDMATVRKSEHDLAMYMLYQRDMRCEELTEELVHLLEERDMLQLKLSNSIRQIEEMNRRLGAEPPTISTSVDSANQTAENLVDKLSQLQRPIGDHTRTKKLREEREHSQRQMALLQQDVATLPAEAVAELIGDYSTPQPPANPSSILLNWLWGNKSPGN